MKRALNESEIAAGWHHCSRWSDRLIGPKSPELGYCTCDLPESAQKARAAMVERENRAWTGGE